MSRLLTIHSVRRGKKELMTSSDELKDIGGVVPSGKVSIIILRL